jgi:hypothetical protein
MSRIFRPIGLLILCFALVAGSVSMAVARGQAAALSQGGTTLVICSGYGVMTVTLDAEGKPVGPVHLCPQCLAGLAAYMPPGLAAVLPKILPSEKAAALEGAHQPRSAGVLVTRARGPPLEG